MATAAREKVGSCRVSPDCPACGVSALAGALCLLLAFGIWLAVVAPVNREVTAAFRAAPALVPELWMRVRIRWEDGHVVGFIVQFVGFCALVLSVLVETPKDSPRERAA